MNLTVLLLTSMLLICSFSQGLIYFGVVGPFTTSAFRCLAKSVPGSTQVVIIRAYQNSHSPAGIDPNAIQTIRNAVAAQFYPDIYVQICRGIDPTSQINLVSTQIMTKMYKQPIKFVFYFYIKVAPSNNSECSWTGYSYLDNCIFLKQVTQAVYNLRVGFSYPVITTTARIWGQLFGNACDSFAYDTSSYVTYAIYKKDGSLDSAKVKNDFVPFGSFAKRIFLKQIGGKVKVPLLCGNKAWHALVDYYWWQ